MSEMAVRSRGGSELCGWLWGTAAWGEERDCYCWQMRSRFFPPRLDEVRGVYFRLGAARPKRISPRKERKIVRPKPSARTGDRPPRKREKTRSPRWGRNAGSGWARAGTRQRRAKENCTGLKTRNNEEKTEGGEPAGRRRYEAGQEHRLKTRHQDEETEGGEPAGRRRYEAKSDGGEEGAVKGDVAVGHAGRIEGEAGIAGFIEEDEAAGAVAALLEELGGVGGGARGKILIAFAGR